MNLTKINNQQLTMSSREIAEPVGKRHDNVKIETKNLRDLSLIAVAQIE
jgi:phage regulator Rha-like protein